MYNNRYTSFLLEVGMYENDIIKIGIVLDGKEVYMKYTDI
jgi:hypothetical protein